MQESERIINEIAQGLIQLDEGVNWFSALDPAQQKAVLREVVSYSMQAHATVGDGREGVARSGVKPTANPAVMIVREPLPDRMAKIINLQDSENVKAFRVLVSTFAVADTRRRDTQCKGRCGHEWHNLTL